MEEIWKPVKGNENEYEVSSLGNIRSLHRKKKCIQYGKEIIQTFPAKNISPCMCKPSNRKTGYYRVGISGKGRYIHRIVAEAFIDNVENKNQVNHKDGNKLNNKAENLEWCTCSENVKHAFDTGLKIHTLKQRRLSSERRLGKDCSGKIVLDTETGIYYESVKMAAKSLNVNHGTLVARIIKGNNKRFIHA